LQKVDNAKCLDPTITKTDGNEIFGIKRKPGFKFQLCKDRTDVNVDEFCQSVDAFQEWLAEPE